MSRSPAVQPQLPSASSEELDEQLDDLIIDYEGKVCFADDQFGRGMITQQGFELRLDELKESLKSKLAQLIRDKEVVARIDELKTMPNHTDTNLHVRDRIAELQAQLNSKDKP